METNQMNEKQACAAFIDTSLLRVGYEEFNPGATRSGGAVSTVAIPGGRPLQLNACLPQKSRAARIFACQQEF